MVQESSEKRFGKVSRHGLGLTLRTESLKNTNMPLLQSVVMSERAEARRIDGLGAVELCLHADLSDGHGNSF